MVNKIIVSKVYSDKDISKLSNTFFDETNINIIKEDSDVYKDDGELLLKFRKNKLSEEEIDILYRNMKSAAPKIGGRPEASGK